ncbi:MAG: UDP-3-O-(3-hydroxymyristoyl)glucosamine N-acyltransferase [Fimbriimonadaceae bacterium]|nr:UDP-3-O-(3-hydroxymyristoyl)glucosamine N-acyltransferase [Fimbriimonadaceae bacterium]
MATKAPYTLAHLAELTGAELRGPGEFLVHRVVSAGENGADAITFGSNEEYIRKALASDVGAIIVPLQAPDLGRPALACDDPRAAFGKVLALFIRPVPVEIGIHPTAIVQPGAKISKDAAIGAYVVVEDGAKIAARSVVGAFGYVGAGCVIGSDCLLHPRVTLVQDVRVGDRSVFHPGSVIGSDGFGYLWDGERRVKVPQVGGVRIGNDVEIGANTTIDRATMGDTIIHDGVKLDNLVQIAHNCVIGDHSVFAAHVGIAGSAKIGRRVVMGGQAAAADHSVIGDDVTLAGRAGVMKKLKEPGEYFGVPPIPVREAMRQMAFVGKLPDLFARIKALEERVKELEG